MSIKNPKIFGLDVNQYFADVLDKDVALKNLGVNALDLSVIYKSSEAETPVDAADWRSFSSLNTPIWKKLDRYSGDAGRYEGLLDIRAGIDKMLFGDLDVNGVLSGSAIRYRYLKGGVTGRIEAINASHGGPVGDYNVGTYTNVYAYEQVSVYVTSSADHYSSASITVQPGLVHDYESTNPNPGGATDHFCVQTAYPITFTNAHRVKIDSDSYSVPGRVLKIDDTDNGGTPDGDYNDLTVRVNKGRFFSATGAILDIDPDVTTVYYILDREDEIPGDGKATFDAVVSIVNGSAVVNATVNNKGSGYSVGDSIKLLGTMTGVPAELNLTVTDTSDDPFRVALADISTSRVSAWSSSDGRANSQNLNIQRLARISYGSRIQIKYNSGADRGLLRFGTQASSTIDNPTQEDTIAGITYTSTSGASGRRLQTTLTPTQVEFPSEIPTSKIKIHLDGDVRYLYAMKGIPLAFRGFFRSLDNVNCTVNTISADGNTISPSWKVVRTDDRNSYSNYKNSLSIPRYRTSRSRERFIELYYPADEITSIRLVSANIEELPVAKFSKLTSFSLNNNNISNFSNFNSITPALQVLDISTNPLHLSETRSERILTQEITNKMPITMKEIYMGRTFNGSVERNIFVDRFPELTTLSFYRGGGQSFYPDDNDRNSSNSATATLPNVPKTIINFNARNNSFRRIDVTGTNTTDTATFTFTGNYENGKDVIYNCSGNTYKLAPGAVLSNTGSDTGIPSNTRVIRIKGNIVTVDKNFTADQKGSVVTITVAVQKQDDTRQVYRDGSWVSTSTGRYSIMNLPDLETLDIYNNYYLSSDTTFELQSMNLKTIDMGHTGLQIPTIPNRLNLTHFLNQYNYTTTSFFTSQNTSGTTDGKHTGYKLAGCSALQEIRCYASRLTGPIPNFSSNSNLRYVDIRGTRITGGDPNVATADQNHVISASTFSQCAKLETFYFSSTTFAKGNNTSDPIEDGIHQNAFLDTIEMRNLLIQSNYQISGRLPIFTTMTKIRYLYLNSNRFTGPLPTFSSNRQLDYIYLHNNELYGTIPPFTDLTSLRRLYLHQNRRGDSTGFTKLSEFSNLSNLDIFYCHYNSIEDDIPNFGGCPRVRYIALYNNKFDRYTEGSIASLTRLRYFDVTNNQLPAGELEKIIADALASYNASNRGGVTIDMRNNYINGNSDNNAPQQHLAISEESLEIVTFLKTQANWNIPGYN